jgi:xylan 1,4-beta-xylosidase
MRARLSFLVLATCALGASGPVAIQVAVDRTIGAVKPVWNYFGYDEPNYTYAPHGHKLIQELAKLGQSPVHIRTHFLLTSSDGTGSLKWGSTNAYTEDRQGRPVYDWTIIDRILDTYVASGAIPFIEIGFMPQALSSRPEPYQASWQPHGKPEDYYLGWTYPPKDYQKWSELVSQWVKHCVAKYGEARVASWRWEVWNEPNIEYWHGTPEEYDKLYDYTAAAVKRAIPRARVGGPASTGPANIKARRFLEQFLEHCASGMNAATGERGAPLDFISYHAKGRPEVVDGHVRMGLGQELRDVNEGFSIVHRFSKFQNLPIVLSEADPEGCAACSARVYPPNAYRNGILYAAYEAAALKSILELSQAAHGNLEGILTWAFEFENQPYFDGFRTLATNGIDKPVLNFFRMAGRLEGDWVAVESGAAISAQKIIESGVRDSEDIDALAAGSGRKADVLVWNYHDDDIDRSGADINLHMTGLPRIIRTLHLQHFRIDGEHSNSYTTWKRLGSPQRPTPAQYRELENAGHLQLLEPPRRIEVRNGIADVQFSLPVQALSLLELTW